MIRYSGIFLSLLMLSGCATEALKNEQAETVITAGNKAVGRMQVSLNNTMLLVKTSLLISTRLIRIVLCDLIIPLI